MLGLSLESWNYFAQITFNILASAAVLGAAIKYLFLSGGPRRHTELRIEIRHLARDAERLTFEATIRIENKGIQLLEVYNIFLHAKSIHGYEPHWGWSSDNLVSVSDQKIWLHANTGITLSCLLDFPANLNVVELELVVPYVQRRLKNTLTGAETAKISDYNSLLRYFPVSTGN